MVWAWIALALFLPEAGNPAEAGLKALDEQRYADAAQAFEQVVEASPDNFAGHFNLAYAYTMLGRRADAIASYEKALELKPGLYQAELNLGIVLLQAQQAARAVPYLSSAAQAKPNEFRPQYYLAEALYAIADDTGAEQAYRKAAELDPSAADVQIGLGRAIFNQGRYTEAEPHYRKAAELDPEYRQFLVELATKFEEKNLGQQAIAIYQEFPDDPVVRERLGHLLLRAGRADEALPHLRAAVGRAPTVANRYALATAYIKTKQPAEAIPQLELALAERPDDYDLLMLHGRLVRDQRRFMDAAHDFLGAVKAKPESKEAWKELAGMLILLENYPRALAALDQVEALGAAPVTVHFFRALIWDKAKDREKALASYERFLELSHEQFPDEEFKARQRIKALKREMRR